MSDILTDKDAPRHSPAPPLAPLEFLQSHRRGSITDPSLHAASAIPSRHLPESAPMPDSRPSSNYVFGDSSDSNTHLRRLLRSPSLEHPDSRPDSSDKQTRQQGYHTDDRRSHQQFNYNMRRHSIATSQDVHASPHGTKRKLSADRNGFSPAGGEIDPQLAGPGIPSSEQSDLDGPPPKRRASVIDARGLAQLTDQRTGQWWSNGRRDSTPVLPSAAALGSYAPGMATDSRLPGALAAFTWPGNPLPPPDAPSIHNPLDPSTGIPRPFDPAAPLAMMPPGFGPDRRMSVPTVLPSVQTRVLRSRSRTPSRQKQNGTASTSPGISSTPEEVVSAPSSIKSNKESSTPYSRSPELRVSHKLAERKRRKEMKDLFDELRDQLPADRGMKASKWEILSKAIDFVTHLKASHQEMLREIEMLRHELDALRQGIPPFPGAPPPHTVVYTQPGTFPPAPSNTLPPQQSQSQQQPHPPSSRPSSSQNTSSPGAAGSSGPPLQNGALDRVEAS